MKLARLTTATLCSAALAFGLAPRIAGAADPPADKPIEQAQPEAMDESAFLGVDTVPLRADAREALGLKPGTALSIRHVAPGTPAEEAGLLPGDVLVRLNDQLIVNGQQLAVLVRTFDPGDAVTLHVLRDGKPMERQATLAGRAIAPQQMFERVPEVLMQPMPNLGDLDAIFDRLRGPGVDPFGPNMDMRDMFDRMQRRMHEQRDEMQRMMNQMRDRIGEQGMRSSISVNDGEHQMRLQSDGQDRYLTVTTRDGEVVFDGPLPKDGQVEGVPANVQRKIDDLLRNNRIEFHTPQPRPQNRQPLPVA
ncbi:MAG: S1C family serine protease [Phycisphaeraceae bacterium]